MSFADNLKRILETKRVSQSELSRRTGINRPMISEYVNGKYEPKTENLFKIAQALAVDLGELSEDYKIGSRLSAFAAGKESIGGFTYSPETGTVIDKHSSITVNGNVNGPVSANGNAVVNEHHVEYHTQNDQCKAMLEALFKDSPDALAYLRSLKINQDGEIEGFKNIDVGNKNLIAGARATWIAALKMALENGASKVKIPL